MDRPRVVRAGVRRQPRRSAAARSSESRSRGRSSPVTPAHAQARRSWHNIRRFLGGVGEPAELHGPIADPLHRARPRPTTLAVTERSRPSPGPDGAADCARRQLVRRQRLADVGAWRPRRRAAASPPATPGASTSEHPGRSRDRLPGALGRHDLHGRRLQQLLLEPSGAVRQRLSTTFDGQNTEQPTSMVTDAISLAGITPTESGFLISPHFPFAISRFGFPRSGSHPRRAACAATSSPSGQRRCCSTSGSPRALAGVRS